MFFKFLELCSTENIASSESPSNVPVSNGQIAFMQDEAEKEAVRCHGEWAVKRTREDVLYAWIGMSTKQAKDDRTRTKVTRGCLLSLLERLGSDQRQDCG